MLNLSLINYAEPVIKAEFQIPLFRPEVEKRNCVHLTGISTYVVSESDGSNIKEPVYINVI